ncbi:MAG: DUF3649 domain-containing protein [Pseudomonadota bacterium]
MKLSKVLKRIYYYPRFSRIMAALIGAYIFANVMSLLSFFVFIDSHELYRETENVNRALIASWGNAFAASTMLGFLIYPLAGMWVFYARSAGRAWAVMMFPSLLGAGLIFWLLPDSLRQALGG